MNTIVTQDELDRRTIRRADLVSCNQAFIDCKTPGSDKKENYALIGSGVSQNTDQVINLREPHGFNVGAAAMPHGITNNLHMHFTAEVFLNFSGEWLFRWGVDGKAGEYRSTAGDVVTVPTWIYRGFTNTGPDDGWLFTVLGMDDTGGILWGPSVLREAANYGLYLTRDNELVENADGEPADVDLIRPMPQQEIDALRHYTPAQMRSRVTTEGDRVWSDRAFLCSTLPGGHAELALVIGFGMTEDRNQEPRVYNPHGFNLAWLRAHTGEGLLQHRHDAPQALIVRSGRWKITLNSGADERSVVLDPRDTLSIPAGAWRRFEQLDDGDGELVVVNGGDGRVRIQWDLEVIERARDKDVTFDANGYVAPWSVLSRSTDDD
ncbi:cupin domain-containing protein [Rhodococcus opacus]|uniref:cupin domain-containing protein n=1 Tax=Rhodococcus opacus TaxID=37919 RepID=UPI00030D3180|nr:cupin domain-containing protein [Rhodococcus opacus]AHK29129.1 hypothetical protein Pd630_LPD01901 [Rhodococcus opacus PD630]UDG98939.1 cupin domain-containing protein [Rhodococcus opacus PD630]